MIKKENHLEKKSRIKVEAGNEGTFKVYEGAMKFLEHTNMTAPKNAKVEIPEDVTKDLPAIKKDGARQVIYQAVAGFHYGDGTPIAFSKSQICDFLGLCRALEILEKQKGDEFRAYQKGLEKAIWDKKHKFICDGNTIRMKLSDFARLSRGQTRGTQTLIKDEVHKNLLFFGAIYGRFIKEMINTSRFTERNEPLIRYAYEEEVKKNRKGEDVSKITYIEITFHDAFIYQGAGFTQVPKNFANLIYDYGRDSIIFTYLLFDILKQRGLNVGTVKEKAKAIDQGKGGGKEKAIAKAIANNEGRIYKRTRKYLLENVLGRDKSRYDKHDDGGFRTTDWRVDLRGAIQSFVKMGLVDDVSQYGDGHGTYIDKDGGLGCDLKINLKW